MNRRRGQNGPVSPGGARGAVWGPVAGPGIALGIVGIVGLAGAVAVLGGCGGKEEFSVATSSVKGDWVLTTPSQRQKRVLSKADQAEAVAAMKSIAEGGEIVGGAGPAVHDMDWNDVPLAVDSAAGKVGIEMVVVYKTETLDAKTGKPIAYRFVLRTIEDWPGVFEVRRIESPEVYEVVECTIGRFPYMQHSVERRDKFLDEFEKQLVLWGKKRKYRE